MKANIVLEDQHSNRTEVESIVDSGAAWCAVRLSVLEEHLSDALEYMEPSTMRFHDASGNRMSLVGKLPLRMRIGGVGIAASVYVFKDLAAPFLLGANALLGNGCIIDCNRSRLYVAGDGTYGIPMTSATCV